MIWNEQTAVITGGASGLGFTLAGKLSSLGANVVLFDQDESRLNHASQQLGGAGTACVDVTDESAVHRAVLSVLQDTRTIDVLINSAGITGKTNVASHEVESADFERVLRINLLGCFHTSKAVLPGMLQRGYGRILHIASISGKEGNAGMLAYSCSKAAVIALAKVQGKETAGSGVTVNALAPAVIRTDMVAAMPEEQVNYMTSKIPMGRCGTLEELAAMGTFIVSPETSFTTGFTFDLSGGRATY
jgi:3-oxoacyl-[acyl-carrier protein] reductase